MEKTTEKNPTTEEVVEECTLAGCPGEPCIGGIGCEKEELYIEPNPTEEEIEEQIRVIEQVNNAIEEADIKITHKGYAEDSIVQQYVQYAYQIGGMDLVTLIECENGTWSQYRQSSVVKNGKREKSFGFCQISQVYHPEIVNTDEFWNNWRWQLDKCNELMNGGTAFYGRDRKIKGVKCSTYVKDRFILES